MTVADRIAFNPGLGWPALAILAATAALLLVVYLWRGGGAPLSRGLGIALILIGLAGPMIVRERREPVADIAAVIVDQSESLALAGRKDAARAAGDAVAARLRAETGLDVRVREVTGGPDGTAMIGALEDALADAPRDRIAGAVLVTDGQVSDVPEDLTRVRQLGPVHTLIVGDPKRGDRRIELISAPAFGIVGEPVQIEARVIDPAAGSTARVRVLVDGQVVREDTVATGRPFTLAIRTPKRGANLVVVEAAPGPQEISAANNRAAFQLAGVRDRLRVLLVTGEPHPGARVWRNFLKSDPSVDLVHFTILRPPEKPDATPQEELALIAFPREELFVEKLDQFDLIIFDRYQRRSILPFSYFENIARRVEAGGALLVSAGPGDAGDDSLSRTPLAAILPSQPDNQVLDGAFKPTPTQLGARHPVLRGLPDSSTWGRWTRMVAARAGGGQVLLTGAEGRPLLVLDRAGRGRVAQLWSDQVWLWARGYDGGGPHGELLRRLAHWLMQEPELEDERLSLAAGPGGLAIERATLGDAPGAVDIVAPDGAITQRPLEAAGPGLFRAVVPDPQNGIYEARSGGLRAFAAVGPLNPKEAAAVAADPTILEPVARETGGGVEVLGERGAPLPEIRRVGRNDGAAGDGWIGLRRREGYVVRASAAEPLGPGVAWAMAGLLLLMLGWRRETR
ncbi:MAG: hypothetical protein KJS97_04880 [Alphaproteobacteria bacterium]|nr:hypothetical protein [Alphaproteobacteria bacterium]